MLSCQCGGAIAFLSVQVTGEVDRSHQPVGAAAPEIKNAHPTAFADVRRSHRPRAPARPSFPNCSIPFLRGFIVVIQALDRRDADGQVQPAIAWVVHPVLVLLHIIHYIGRDLPRIVIGAACGFPRSGPARKPRKTWRT